MGTAKNISTEQALIDWMTSALSILDAGGESREAADHLRCGLELAGVCVSAVPLPVNEDYYAFHSTIFDGNRTTVMTRFIKRSDVVDDYLFVHRRRKADDILAKQLITAKRNHSPSSHIEPEWIHTGLDMNLTGYLYGDDKGKLIRHKAKALWHYAVDSLPETTAGQTHRIVREFAFSGSSYETASLRH